MSNVPVVLFRDSVTGEYLVPRPSPGQELLQPGDEVVLYNGRTVVVTRIVRRSEEELQIICEGPGSAN